MCVCHYWILFMSTENRVKFGTRVETMMSELLSTFSMLLLCKFWSIFVVCVFGKGW